MKSKSIPDSVPATPILRQQLPRFPDAGWPEMFKAFAHCPALPLRQAWRDGPEPGFAGGAVQPARDDTGLWILARLEGPDFRSRARNPNDPMWALGDAFEIFLRPPDSTAYWEFHVAPGNLRLRLKFPHAAAVYERKRALGPRGAPDDLIRPFLLRDDFDSRIRRPDDDGPWTLLARIPFALLGRPRPDPGEIWTGAFCRYHYRPGRPDPMLSSTAPLTRPDFHHQPEWNRFVFIPAGD